jgi:hypothetical protein
MATPSKTMLKNRIQECEQALRRYTEYRPALFRHLLLVPKGWRITYVRDPRKGDRSLPVKFTDHVSTDIKLEGLSLDCILNITIPENYAPFDFALQDSQGNTTKPNTEAAVVEFQLEILLQKILDVMKVFAGNLPIIEQEAKARNLQTDTTALSRLNISLPVFPYWPTSNWPTLSALTQAYCDKIIAEEKPLLDDARLILHRLGMDAEMSDSPKNLSGEHAKDGPATTNVDSSIRDAALEKMAAELGMSIEDVLLYQFLKEHRDLSDRDATKEVMETLRIETSKSTVNRLRNKYSKDLGTSRTASAKEDRRQAMLLRGNQSE